MTRQDPSPARVVLICHEDDRIDREGTARWLATDFRLAGLVLLRDAPGAGRQKLRRELRRVGPLRIFDVLAFRAWYRLTAARHDRAWLETTVDALRARYPASLDTVPTIHAHDPNDDAVANFLAEIQPDFAIARCKHLLKPRIFRQPSLGTFVLHPGICPQYRNAHGCFWALVNRDLERVGMTLLKIDEGIDTGPAYLQAGYPYDECNESHFRIQHRVVLENLDAIGRTLRRVCDGQAQPLALSRDGSANWGQPWLSAWIRWKTAARQDRQTAARNR